MKILFAVRPTPSDVGGVQLQLQLIAGELSRRHHVEIVTVKHYDKGWRRPRWVRYVLRNAGQVGLTRLLHSVRGRLRPRAELITRRGSVTTHSVANAWIDHLLQLTDVEAYEAILLPALRALVRGKDIVHSMTNSALGIALEKAARAEGVPFLLTPFVHPDRGDGERRLVPFYNRADIVFGLLNTDAEKLVELGVRPEKIRLMGVVPRLPETVDPAGFRERRGLEGKPVVVFVGRMVRYKGVPSLLDAAPLVWTRNPEVHFLFAGPTDQAAQGWFEGRDPRIRYIGLITDQEKGDALAACDLFCMPSQFEILPAVYLEAWSYGKAVIGGPAHGLKELIEGNGAGRVVNQDPVQIAGAIFGLLSDDRERREMGERGRILVTQRYSRDAVVAGLELSYREIRQTAAASRAATSVSPVPAVP